MRLSAYPLRAPLQEISHYVLPQRHGIGEVSLAACHLTDLRNEMNQCWIAREHECVDEDAVLSACGHFAHRFANDMRVETGGILVDAAIGHRDGGWLAVRNHYDLLHVFLLRAQQTACDLEAFRRIRVVGSNLGLRQLAHRNFLRAIAERNDT